MLLNCTKTHAEILVHVRFLAINKLGAPSGESLKYDFLFN